MLSICPTIGKAASTQHVLPIFLLLLRDENSEVRLNLFKRLDDLNTVIGIEELQTSLIPSLEELAKEKNWRLKISVIEQFPMLAR
jgi:serine/threonine-protein phosphatase 2A regulatory subunit A